MTLSEKLDKVAKSGLTIYDVLGDDSPLFLTTDELRKVLNGKLRGLNLNYPLRTRSKVVKSAVCRALGYPVPSSFKRTRPRFPGQDFDTYVQKSNNLQVWNEVVSPTRRYAVIRVDDKSIVSAVQVVTGEALARYDRTGTLTSKFQAIRKAGRIGSLLVSEVDTATFRTEFKPQAALAPEVLRATSPTAVPTVGKVLTIAGLFQRLVRLVGTEMIDPGLDQERVRGAALQELVCSALGLGEYADKGQLPDVLSQVLEVKLQLARTIDLGLVSPDGTEPVPDIPQNIKHCDIRYAVFYAQKGAGGKLKVAGVVVSTGSDFFTEFTKCLGKEVNRKLQIPLPTDFFD